MIASEKKLLVEKTAGGKDCWWRRLLVEKTAWLCTSVGRAFAWRAGEPGAIPALHMGLFQV